MAGGLQFVTGTPTLATFRSGGGDVVAIDLNTSTPYYANPLTGAVTAFAGGGGGMVNPMSGVGDMIVGGAAGTPVRLPPGVDGLVLTLVSGSPAWTTPAAGGLTASQVQAIIQLPNQF